MKIDKRTANIIALIVTIVGWVIGMLYNIGWGIIILVSTFGIMKLTNQTSGYPFDWLIKGLFSKKGIK